MPTQGSWSIGGYKLPEFGITEAIGGALGRPRDPLTQGSQIFGGSNAQSTPQVMGASTVNQSTPAYGPQPMIGPQASQGAPVKFTGSTTPTPVQQPPGAPPTPQGLSNSEIDSIYNPSMDYLNQAEGTLRNDYTNVLSQAEKDFQTLQSQLTGNKNTNLATIGENQVKATQVKDDALSAARRLYDELKRGYSQRFGGSTSAGGAASEIASVEQQRQMGQTSRQYTDTIRQLEGQKQQVEQEYQTGLLKLEQNKQQAITQAQSDFQNKLLEIANNRTQIESAKAQQKLEALQQLRNSVFQIQQQTYQFQQTLDAQKKQSDIDLQNYMARLNAQGQASGTSVQNSGINTDPTSSLQAGYTSSPTTQGLTGQITTQKKDQYDEYGRRIN